MLTEIREKSSGLFAWGIALLIIIPMAFFGVNQYVSSQPEPMVVEIGEQKITQREYQNAVLRQQQYMRRIMGDNVDNNLLNSPQFKQNVLQQLISQAVVNNTAKENKYRIGDSQLSELIKESDVFKKDGKFNVEAYEKYVQSQQYSKTQFETRLRDQSRLAQVSSGYQESAFVLPVELSKLIALRSEKRSFDLVSIGLDEFKKAVKISDKQIATYYEANKINYYQPEQVSIEYMQIKLDDLLSEITVDEEELKAIYEQDTESYGTAEKRNVRHILLKLEKDSTEEQEQQIKQQALELIIDLKKGADFAQLAKKHSQDVGSASKGGDLGEITYGQMVEPFEKAAYALAKNEISEPIKSRFGYHIIRVDDIEEASTSYEEARVQIEQQEKTRLAEVLFLERVEQLTDLTYEHPDSLEVAAEELKLTIQKSEFFTRQKGEGIARFPVIREAAFNEEVLIENINSETIELSPTEYLVLRKLEFKESAPKPLELVKQDIQTLLENTESSRLVREKGAALLAEIQASKWADIIAREKLRASSYTVSLANKTGVVSASVLNRIFALSVGDKQPVVDGLQDATGTYYLFSLNKVEQSDVAQVEDKVKQDAIDILSRRTGKAYLDSYLNGLTEHLQPDINQDLL